ncbi:MAG: RHS repeat-associated core domain-containing protein [Bacteroidales bacterium]|nr:RHS repeat-associated core domain-containing protein [Bacteroidales bacterium]
MHRICHFTYRSTTRYWYHPDHLGSASWVSDKAGKGIQHLYYLPWGEELDNQRATDYASRYTFSGKERDEETGYSYFGARYYNSALSIWLSVDPMSDKYPSTSPYTYCANNPVKLVDEDGESFSEFDENGNYLRTIKDNWWHNLWHGRKGRIVDGEGNIIQTFRFADPINDVADLKKGTINKIYFVQENEIVLMLTWAGAFDKENKVMAR